MTSRRSRMLRNFRLFSEGVDAIGIPDQSRWDRLVRAEATGCVGCGAPRGRRRVRPSGTLSVLGESRSQQTGLRIHRLGNRPRSPGVGSHRYVLACNQAATALPAAPDIAAGSRSHEHVGWLAATFRRAASLPQKHCFTWSLREATAATDRRGHVVRLPSF